jgi:hypothetical protein
VWKGVQWRFKLLYLVAVAVDYAAVFTMISVWQNLSWAYAISFIVGFCSGVVVAKAEDFVVLWVFSYILASLMAVLVFISPGLYPEVVWAKVEIGILGGAGIVAFNSIIIVPLSLCAGIIGLFISDRYFRRYKVPLFVESRAV